LRSFWALRPGRPDDGAGERHVSRDLLRLALEIRVGWGNEDRCFVALDRSEAEVEHIVAADALVGRGQLSWYDQGCGRKHRGCRYNHSPDT
jgi:hypothetical protein